MIYLIFCFAETQTKDVSIHFYPLVQGTYFIYSFYFLVNFKEQLFLIDLGNQQFSNSFDNFYEQFLGLLKSWHQCSQENHGTVFGK